MKKSLIVLFSIFAVLFLIVSELPAQRGSGQGRNRENRNYNPATVETVTGTIADINTVTTWGLHVSLKNEKGTISVHLGPEWFIKDKLSISKGDSITVVGSRVKQDGADVIIAKSVRKNGITLLLRDDNGIPKWSGQGKRRR